MRERDRAQDEERAANARMRRETWDAALRAACEDAPNLAGILALDGTVLHANRAACALIGRDPSDVVGQPIWAGPWWSHDPAERDRVREAVRRGATETVRLETTHASVEGEVRLIDLTLRPMADETGAISRLIAEGRDVTDRRRSERALEGASRRLRMLRDSNQALIRAEDETALLATVCAVAVDVGGYRMAWVGYAEDDAEQSVRPMAWAGEGGDAYLEELGVVWSDTARGQGPVGTAIRAGRPCPVQDIQGDARFGLWRDLAAHYGYAAACGLPLIVGNRVVGALAVYSPEPDAFDDPEVAHLGEMAADLAFGIQTLRGRAEHIAAGEALKSSEERFRRLVLNSSDIVAVLDGRGAYRSISGPVATALGHRPEDLIETSAFDLVHPDDLRAVLAAFVDAISAPGTSRRLEYRYRHRDGHWIWLEGVGTNLLDDPYVSGIVLNIRDITERRRVEEERVALENQLQQAMKMEAVGRLAGGVAHDFNNLLTAISGNVELARLEFAPTGPLLHYLEEVGRAAESAAALTRQLLAFSRRQIIEPRVLNLNDLVEHLRGMLVRLIGEDVELAVVLPPDLWPVRVDPGQFEQVVVNLAVNARDAMPDGGRLVIETANVELDAAYAARHPLATAGQHVMLAVSDTGHGMTDEVKRRLFEPFFTTKPMGRGTGLGLATIFGAVRQARGNVEVYTEIDSGTTFKIYLPRVSDPAEVYVTPRSPDRLPTGTETVLLVEDEASVRDLAHTLLERLGYRVLVATNGVDALELARGHADPIHLLLTDIVMPRMNGRELSERLVQLHPETRVLLFSGYTENVLVNPVGGELRNFIGKPFTVQSMAVKLRDVLEQDPA